jgi:hypothetical protein
LLHVKKDTAGGGRTKSFAAARTTPQFNAKSRQKENYNPREDTGITQLRNILSV